MKAVSGTVLLLVALVSCRQAPEEQRFPKPHRAVSPIIGDSFSTEDARDRLGEAEQVMALAAVKPGMWVADVGAGEGYYTIRLAPAVGPRGRVLAEDIVEETRDRLAQRVQRERLDNVAVLLGKPDDPMLPPRSFDRVFLVHMYHEVQSPYAFLWHLREGLKPSGLVVVVDLDRPTKRHGISPALLTCEFAAVGMARVDLKMLAGGDSYLATYKIAVPRPRPAEIKPCRALGRGRAGLQQAHPAQAAALEAGEHQMIEDRAVQRFRRAGQPARRPAILAAGRRIAARMVVGEHDPGAAMGGRVGDDRAQWETGARFIASVAAQVNTAGLVVDVGDPQALEHGIGIGEASGEKVARGFEPVQFQGKFGTLVSHAEDRRSDGRRQPLEPRPRRTR